MCLDRVFESDTQFAICGKVPGFAMLAYDILYMMTVIGKVTQSGYARLCCTDLQYLVISHRLSRLLYILYMEISCRLAIYIDLSQRLVILDHTVQGDTMVQTPAFRTCVVILQRLAMLSHKLTESS